MIKVLVADDHAIVRRGLKEILADIPDMIAAGEAGSGGEVLQAVRREPYDVVLLDIALPDINGLEILRQLQGLGLAPHVLILSAYPEEQYAVRALKSGAAGYLTKESAPDELIAAIRKASQGGKYVSQSLAEQLAVSLALDPAQVPHEALSNREFQVMRLLADGKSVTEIAQELALSAKTISTYRTRILKKLGLRNTAEIVRYAIMHGLTE